MTIKLGYLYHIKDEFFEVVKDKYLMRNHENGHSRPNYFILKDGDYYWAIPLSSKSDKYRKILMGKRKQLCKTIIIVNINNIDSIILLQNAFPITEKYINNVHMFNGKKSSFNKTTEKEILKNFRKMLILKEKGINLFYPNVDNIKLMLNKELVH